MSVFRILSYTSDVGLDIFCAYIFINDPDLYIFGIFTIVFTILPIIPPAIGNISDVIRNNQRNVLTKVLLVTATICIAPFRPLYYLVKASIAAFKGDNPENRAEGDAACVILLEAMLEAFPQSCLRVMVINLAGTNISKILFAIKSIITICFAVSTSTYLFKAPIGSRVIFFFGILVTLISRLMIWLSVFNFFDLNSHLLSHVPCTILVISAVIMWFVKRVSKCSGNTTPLADIHHLCSKRSMLHVPLTWTLTAVCNCFTPSGLLVSLVTMVPAGYMAIMTTWKYVEDVLIDIHYYTVAYIALSAMSFITNLLFVTIPICRRNIGDHWLNKDENGKTWLY